MATIVAVLLGGGVLLGCSALSIDVGSIMFERRQLQNGADASAMALAGACATGVDACGANTGTTAGAITNSTLTRLNNVNNTKDQLGGFDPAYVTPSGSLPGLCASSASYGLPVCPTPTSSVTDCGPVPTSITSAGAPYVEVHTITKQSGSRPTILPNAISSFIAGGTSGESVKACARAAWGAAGSGNSLPITVSSCDWKNATGGNSGGGGGSYWDSPDYSANPSTHGYSSTGSPRWPTAATPIPNGRTTPPLPTPGQEVILMLQNPTSSGSHATEAACTNWQGHDVPGGFGALETTADPCVVQTYPYNWMHTSTGNNLSCNLSSLVGKVVSFPVFDCTLGGTSAPTSEVLPSGSACDAGSGNNAWFHREGYALFYLSGYNMNVAGQATNQVASLVPPYQAPCGNPNSCISGWFLTGELTATIVGPPTQSYFGAVAVSPAG